MKNQILATLAASLLMGSSLAMAQSQSLTIDSTNQSTVTFEKSKETSNIAASNRSQALITDSIYYSLPHEDMTFIELGAFSQRQSTKTFTSSDKSKFSNQVFFFKHSRGLSEDIALDFNLDYFIRDENSARATGVNEALLGARSHFEGLGMNWIYGAHLIYLPDGEALDNSSKLAIAAKIGFEEAVDIARWGIETELSTKDSAFFQNSFNLLGFFEIPFVKTFNMGVSAGADLTKLTASQQNNFAKVYGQYNIDAVSGAQLSLRQVNQKDGDSTLTETEAGLALTRVF